MVKAISLFNLITRTPHSPSPPSHACNVHEHNPRSLEVIACSGRLFLSLFCSQYGFDNNFTMAPKMHFFLLLLITWAHLANPRGPRAIISHPDPPPGSSTRILHPIPTIIGLARSNNNQHVALQRGSLHPAFPPREALPRRIQRVHAYVLYLLMPHYYAVLFLVLEFFRCCIEQFELQVVEHWPADFTS
jgi:hypothetical protein